MEPRVHFAESSQRSLAALGAGVVLCVRCWVYAGVSARCIHARTEGADGVGVAEGLQLLAAEQRPARAPALQEPYALVAASWRPQPRCAQSSELILFIILPGSVTDLGHCATVDCLFVSHSPGGGGIDRR